MTIASWVRGRVRPNVSLKCKVGYVMGSKLPLLPCGMERSSTHFRRGLGIPIFKDSRHQKVGVPLIPNPGSCLGVKWWKFQSWSFFPLLPCDFEVFGGVHFLAPHLGTLGKLHEKSLATICLTTPWLYHRVVWWFVTQTLHVWNIYLHVP